MSHVASTVETSKSWTRDGFFISTDTSLVPIPVLNKAFESEEIYWAKGLPEPVMQEMLDNSVCFGLYSPTPSPPPPTTVAALDASAAFDSADILHEIATPVQTTTTTTFQEAKAELNLIGFARAITDRVTFFYLTDVYVLPAWQGRGLGNWLVSCVQEVVEDMPYLRRSMLVIGHDRESRMGFYKRLMKMEPLGDPAMVLNWKGPGCAF
ncbi:uncharacterized protein Z518_07624 [Rhinocladiella mackenziei CBS 650.93]|uniref:N-acetyltransferase domain-containing protein n=1 Tax=Rhinocladiella mackenziei CBS 650.93 TaxID=1442369 RepID=A0A0D2ILK9_9EURO|nr:uncharacterized protein Z518_07624 [Rhinocladiella mackenziei CBS 650.93]KIX04071.1 hypothetical protein Z518_07624 [Rhinocladiella mackenziei CBS 650.93]